MVHMFNLSQAEKENLETLLKFIKWMFKDSTLFFFFLLCPT